MDKEKYNGRKLSDKELEQVTGGNFRDGDVGKSVEECVSELTGNGYDVVVE